MKKEVDNIWFFVWFWKYISYNIGILLDININIDVMCYYI